MKEEMTLILLLTHVISLVSSSSTTCDIQYDKEWKGSVADCSGRDLTSVPRDLPVNIVALYLQRNSISRLSGEMFAPFTELKSLQLSNNMIELFENDTFHGLYNLMELDLSENRYLDNGSYPFGIFQPVKNLASLSLGGITRAGLVFPGYIFEPLSQLKNLLIEGSWSFIFFRQCTVFNNLKHLETLFLHTDWNVYQHLTNDTFACLETLPLKNLTIQCSVRFIDSCVFCPLKNLSKLKIDTLYYSEITLRNVTHSLFGLTNRDYVMYDIDLRNVQYTHTPVVDIILDREVVSYLLDVCVERLDLSGNKLMTIKKDTFRQNDRFTTCLKYIDISRNNLVVDFFAIMDMKFFINLRFADVSGQFYVLVERSQNMNRKELGRIDKWVMHLSFPRKLEYLNISNSGYSLSMPIKIDVDIRNGNNLKILDISHNWNLDIQAKLHGLSNITYLDISGQDISETTFFNTDMFSNTETLIAHDTKIFRTFLMSENSTFSLLMPKLKKLDLSGNNVDVVSDRTFSRLSSVHALSLSRNKLSYISPELLHMLSLKFLDLSFNYISVIHREERKELDMIWERQGMFNLNILGNSLSCACDNINFIKWLHETQITFENKENYFCLSDHGTTISTIQFYHDVLLHWRRCIGQKWLILAVFLQCLMIICLMSAFLLKKYFPKVEHHILQILGYSGKVAPKRCDFTYDAYICYEDKKYQWPCLCLFQKLLQTDATIKLYLPDLHELPGTAKAEATIDAISKSWKLIIVVTEDLFMDEWSYFTVLTAVRLFSLEEVVTSRILLLYQDITPRAKARVPRILFNVVPEENILEVKPGDDDFWAELYQMIINENMHPEIAF